MASPARSDNDDLPVLSNQPHKPVVRSTAKRRRARADRSADETIRAGDLCYVRVTMWDFSDGKTPVCHEYYPVVRVISVRSHDSPGRPASDMSFQIVWCPSNHDDVRRNIREGLVLKSPFFTASYLVKYGKTRQQPHSNGLQHIFKIPEAAVAGMMNGVVPSYQANTDVDYNLKQLRPVTSALVCTVVDGRNMFVSDEQNELECRMRVLVETVRLANFRKELQFMAGNQISMLLWGTSNVRDMFKGLEGYAPTDVRLPFPPGFAFDGKGVLITPTGHMDIHLFKPVIVSQMTRFKNGFRMGYDGTVYVPIQPCEHDQPAVKATIADCMNMQVGQEHGAPVIFDIEDTDDDEDNPDNDAIEEVP